MYFVDVVKTLVVVGEAVGMHLAEMEETRYLGRVESLEVAGVGVGIDQQILKQRLAKVRLVEAAAAARC